MSEAVRTLLVVDDSPEDRAMVRRLLRGSSPPYAVVEAETAGEALDRFRASVPDLVLLDFHLPDREGLEVLAALARGGRPLPVPVVMLTGHGDDEIASAALNGGAQDYVIKGSLTARQTGIDGGQNA